MARLNYLDNLKVALTFLVIFHHAGQAYGDGGEWGYIPSNSAEIMPWIWHFFSTNAAFFMGLYFFISGYFVPGSYDRQGFGTFLRKKILRLGVPLLLMGGFLTNATGKVEIAHMWFVESLLIFSFVYAIIRKRCSAQSYGAYIVHLPLMIGIQNVFDDVWMGAFGKFMFIGIATSLLSFILTCLLRLIPGVKRIM